MFFDGIKLVLGRYVFVVDCIDDFFGIFYFIGLDDFIGGKINCIKYVVVL